MQLPRIMLDVNVTHPRYERMELLETGGCRVAKGMRFTMTWFLLQDLWEE